ncbi:LysR family transcriptional regulator [Fusibacter bizertensis]
MDIKQLTYFVEVAKEKSFTKAAANCFISQPALSKSIRQLETELNSKLFIRNYANFELTKEGEILLDDAVDILNRFNKIKSRIESTGTKRAKPLKISVSPFLGNAFFGNIIAEFCESNPSIPIDYYESDPMLSSISNYLADIDLTVLLLSNLSHDILKDYEITELISCHLVGLTTFASDSDQLRLESLKNQTIITANDVLQLIQDYHLVPFGKRHVFSSSNAQYLKKMILQKKGILILPDFIARTMSLNEPDYVVRALDVEIPCKVLLISKKGSTRIHKMLLQKILMEIQRLV